MSELLIAALSDWVNTIDSTITINSSISSMVNGSDNHFYSYILLLTLFILLYTLSHQGKMNIIGDFGSSLSFA